eukprot:GEMP01049848.1.p1 GENE.GEMP01049848.1~~GEMP01049848.1.p1  ORF type:complete len:248 (+),score=67.92 GEMP01049848.1:41-784(+)
MAEEGQQEPPTEGTSAAVPTGAVAEDASAALPTGTVAGGAVAEGASAAVPTGAVAVADIIPFVPHDKMPNPVPEGVEVVYCPTCGLPPDFCNYGPKWEECRPWVLEHFPQYYPDLAGLSLEDAKRKAEEARDKGRSHILPGGKKIRDQSPTVQVRKLTRSGRKCVTTVQGLDAFGIKLDAACKLFKKKFACGASVVSNAAQSLPDEIDIQGDFEEELIQVLTENYPVIHEDKILFLDGGTKKKGKKK